jgi:hypothetical protein
MRFRGNLQAEIGAGKAQLTQKISRGRAEYLKHKLILNPVPGKNTQKLVSANITRLLYITQYKNGAITETPDIFYIPGYILRRAKGGLPAAKKGSEG